MFEFFISPNVSMFVNGIATEDNLEKYNKVWIFNKQCSYIIIIIINTIHREKSVLEYA